MNGAERPSRMGSQRQSAQLLLTIHIHKAILYSFLYARNTRNQMVPLLGCKMGDRREKNGEVAVWTPQRTSRWRDGKEKAPEAPSKLSLRHLAVLTMSNFLLVPHAELEPAHPAFPLPATLHVDIKIWQFSSRCCGDMLHPVFPMSQRSKKEENQAENY